MFQLFDWFCFFTDLTVLPFTLSRLGLTFPQLVIAVVCVTRASMDGVSFYGSYSENLAGTRGVLLPNWHTVLVSTHTFLR
jgi:hypothetical protein